MYRIALVILALALSGCTTVRFNQQKRLAQPAMNFDSDSLTAELRAHVLTPREAAIGGFTARGAGGCGCN